MLVRQDTRNILVVTNDTAKELQTPKLRPAAVATPCSCAHGTVRSRDAGYAAGYPIQRFVTFSLQLTRNPYSLTAHCSRRGPISIDERGFSLGTSHVVCTGKYMEKNLCCIGPAFFETLFSEEFGAPCGGASPLVRGPCYNQRVRPEFLMYHH